MGYFVYVLRSSVDGRLYKGVSDNLERRLEEHNNGRTKSTKGYRPWEIVYSEKYVTFEEARAREVFLKSGVGRDFLRKIIGPVA